MVDPADDNPVVLDTVMAAIEGDGDVAGGDKAGSCELFSATCGA